MQSTYTESMLFISPYIQACMSYKYKKIFTQIICLIFYLDPYRMCFVVLFFLKELYVILPHRIFSSEATYL